MFNSCKKIDSSFNETNIPAKADYFLLSDSFPLAVRKVAGELNRQNKLTNFLPKMIKQNGNPLWDKAIVTYKNKPAASFTQQLQGETDTVVYVPFVAPNDNIVNSFIVGRVNDSTKINLYRGSDYNKYRYGPVQDAYTTADKIAFQLLILNEQVFGHRTYMGTDKNLFQQFQQTVPDTSLFFIELNLEDPNPTSANYVHTYYLTYCVPRPATGSCNAISYNNITPGIGNWCCGSSSFQVEDEYQWPPEDNPPTGGGNGGSGSGGGGGGSEPPEEDCTGETCMATSQVMNGILPCGDCGPGPIVIAPEPETDANGFYYSRIAELNSILAADPFALEPCDSLTLINLQTYGAMYQDVASFHPDITVKNRLDSIRNANGNWIVDNFNLQNIEDAFGPVVNCDYFPIQITLFPINPLTNLRFTPQEFLEFFRLSINNYITPPVGVSFDCNLTSQVNDCYKWYLPGVEAKGALSHIHIPGPLGMSNDGTVILSDYQNVYNGIGESHKFRFSTIETPFDNEHPVAGNRQFGVFNTSANPGVYTFYTMGVDRIWDWQTQIANDIHSGFTESDTLWTNILANVNGYINNTGASSFYSQQGYIARPKWAHVREYLRKDINFVTLKQRLGC
ncbi:MAG: hypothetical protein ABIT96_07085 [Ferruginibacter sp.]